MSERAVILVEDIRYLGSLHELLDLGILLRELVSSLVRLLIFDVVFHGRSQVFLSFDLALLELQLLFLDSLPILGDLLKLLAQFFLLHLHELLCFLLPLLSFSLNLRFLLFFLLFFLRLFGLLRLFDLFLNLLRSLFSLLFKFLLNVIFFCFELFLLLFLFRICFVFLLLKSN